MTVLQKVIKYAAIAFGICLIISIAIGIIGILNLPKDISAKEMQTIALKDEKITALDIELDGMKLVIETGETLAASSNNENVTCSQKDGKLSFVEKSGVFQHTINGTLKLTLPEDLVLDVVELDLGAGKVVIDRLVADRIEFEFGAGEVSIGELKVSKIAEIDCGASEFTLQSGLVYNLDLDLGVGKVNFKADIFGNSEINCGVGELNLSLGKKSDYTLALNKGLGSIRIDGRDCTDFGVGGGANKLKVDGGVGSINVNFIGE